MRIVSLEAENYKRLRAVEITPDGDLMVVGGRNAQGKSSVLDAIWAALGGREGNKAAKPIRDGEESARVRLDLGDMIVTRTWRGENSTVKVESTEGAVFKSPQALLDGLVGKLSFDPLAFTRLGPREQREALLSLVDLDVDLDALDRERAEVFATRTEIGRRGKSIGDVPAIDDALPKEEQSASEILGRIREANEQQRAVVEAEQAVDDAGERLTRLRAELAAAETAYDEADKRAAALTLPEVDVETLERELGDLETTNAAIRANNSAKALLRQKTELGAEYESLTRRIESLDGQKEAALAGASFPVEGLGFDESGVTFQGVPFTQASSAEQIRVSLAMAIAANPKLRVVRIMDGSLLDDENLKMIAAVAAEHDMQVWIERVGADGVGVIIEDGEVAA